MATAWHDTVPEPSDETDHERLYAIARGDADAFTQLFRAYGVTLVGSVNRIVRNPAVAEELVQDVFLRIWRAGASLRVTGSVRGYLFIAVRNEALKWLRRQGIEHRWWQYTVDHVSDDVSQAPDPIATLEGEAVDARVRAAIAQLPPRGREILMLRWNDQLSYNEIAAVTGLAVKTVENHIARALKILRELLGPNSSDWG
jgi:RNA polymerase sigma-70 factor (ECF subfamily)